jgi:hypothetical protein
MRHKIRILVQTFVLLIVTGTGYIFSQERNPYIAYIYPAGGQRGTTVTVLVGGQNLRGANDVYFSREGLRATVINYQGPSGILSPLQQEELRRRIQEIRDKRAGKKIDETTRTETEKKVTLPDIPELQDLENKTPRQLQQIFEKYLNFQNRPKPPMAEEVTLKIEISPDAQSGDYEIRLKTQNGLTNPVVFQVGKYRETCCRHSQYRYENENSDQDTEVFQVPVVLNGRIMPGKVNRFTLQLQKGQNLIIFVQARKLIPFIADAVPGWFQAVLAIYDKNGKQLLFVDGCGFEPDPAAKFNVPEDGKYILEIRDSIYRGREDFVYRIYVVDKSQARLFFSGGMYGGVCIIEKKPDMIPPVEYNSIPGYVEIEHKRQFAASISIPVLIKGCINYPGCINQYRFYGKQGDIVVIEVIARRIGSPVDSLVKLAGPDGEIVQLNDDMKQNILYGLLTHNADSYLMVKLPKTGSYSVQILDAQGHGGDEYQYFMRITNPMGDFALFVSPSQINIPAGGLATAAVYAMKKDGWDQDIELQLKNAPDGFILNGGKIPKGKDKVFITIKAPAKFSKDIFPVEIEGIAIIDGKEVRHTATPCETKMQAFAYYHLVPSEKLLISTTNERFRSMKLSAGENSIKIPAGGSTMITCNLETWFRPAAGMSLSFELKEPPEGIRIKKVSFDSGRYILTIEADKKLEGYRDNMIIEVYDEIVQPGGMKRKILSGFLPAMQYEVVKSE